MARSASVKAKAKTAGDEREMRRSTSRKQAVLLIHGMGEQVPLGTLREFVETVYQRDKSLLGEKQDWQDEEAPADDKLNQVWMVPDDATGTAELRRITTPPNQEGLRTDFFEFYWADITEGTSIEAVLGWVKGLVFRPWDAVPKSRRVRIAWVTLCVISALFVAYTLSTLDPTGTLFSWLIWPTKYFFAAIHLPLGLLLTAAGVGWWIRQRYYSETPPARIKVTPLVILVVGGIVLAFLPRPLLDSDKVWSGLIALGLAALLNGIIAPYVGDVVRYVRANPATVEKRRQVRERGLKLLEDLHRINPVTGLPMYERVIVVAHSLGSIIGYDLIQLYWEKQGPTHRCKPLPEAQATYDAVDAFVRQWWVNKDTRPDSFDLDDYQQRQSELFELVKQNLKFRISDFVTLGSPLTHAQFLLRDDSAALETDFEERLFSSSPPRPDRPFDTMIYKTHDTTNEERGPFLHFAAPFAAVRWTNIYDEHWFPLKGDIVSGSLTESFGPGIREHNVPIERPGLIEPLNRAVTHTLYWAWHKSFSKTVPTHIKVLRDALFLRADMISRLSPAKQRAAKAQTKAE